MSVTSTSMGWSGEGGVIHLSWAGASSVAAVSTASSEAGRSTSATSGCRRSCTERAGAASGRIEVATNHAAATRATATAIQRTAPV
jgi:hypothetical protein